MGNALIQDSATGQMMELREGFIPVGMKEHGGILYIVSADKEGNGEIGTIPSPIITWDYFDASNKLMESNILVDGNQVKTEQKISTKVKPGEQYAVILNLETYPGLWNGKYFECPDLGYYDPIKSLQNKNTTWQKDNSPLISTIDQKGFYTINLYSNNDYTSYLIKTDKKQQYYTIGENQIKESNFWFIPIQELLQSDGNIQELNKKYMTIDGLFSKYPGTIPSGKLIIKPELENIQEFELVKRAGSLLNTKLSEGYIPYTMEDKGKYYTFFSSFRYKSNSSVRVEKLKIRIVRKDTNEEVPIYYNVSGYGKKIEDGILVAAEEKVTGINNANENYEKTNNLISRNYDSSSDFYTFKYDDWYYLLRKVYEDFPENNSFKSFKNSDNPSAERHGLFYIISEEYNVWYTLYVEYFDQTDRQLGTYEVKFNPFSNDYTGNGWGEYEVDEKREQTNLNKYSFEQKLEGQDSRLIYLEIQGATSCDKIQAIKTENFSWNPKYEIPNNYLNIKKLQYSSEFYTNTTPLINPVIIPTSIEDWETSGVQHTVNYNITVNNSNIFANKTDYSQTYWVEAWSANGRTGRLVECDQNWEFNKTLNKSIKTITITTDKFSGTSDPIDKSTQLRPTLYRSGGLEGTYYCDSFNNIPRITNEGNQNSLRLNIKGSNIFKIRASIQNNEYGVSIGSNFSMKTNYGLYYIDGSQKVAKLAKADLISAAIEIPEKVTLEFNKPVYNTRIISQIDHYYLYRDPQGVEHKTLGNVTKNNISYPTTLYLNSEGKPINYVVLTDHGTKDNPDYSRISSSNISNIFRNDTDHNPMSQLKCSINQKLWVDSRLFNINMQDDRDKFKEVISFNPLNPGTYVIQMIFTNNQSGLNGNQHVTIKLGETSITLNEGQIYVIKIDKQITPEIVPYGNDTKCFTFIDFGIYRNEDVKELEIGKPYMLQDIKDNTKVILPLSETFTESGIDCLGTKLNCSYPPINAYQTNRDMDQQLCQYTVQKLDNGEFGTVPYFTQIDGKNLITHLDINNLPQIRFINE